MKDKHAVTTQWISFLAAKARPPAEWQLPESLRVLEVTRHANKLRTGHLRANRFSVRLVGVERTDSATVDALVARIDQQGIPNYFGAQRFGQGQGNLAEALGWLKNPGRGRRGHFYEKLFPSVIQSELFNRTLGRRIAQIPNTLLEGDVVRLSGSTRHFVVEDPAKEQPRLEARDILLTGPMLGPKMLQPRGAALEFEQRLVDELGLTPADLERLSEYAPGTRRDAMLWPERLTATIESPEQLLLAFTLDAGSYATQVVREFSRAPFGNDGRGDGPSAKNASQEESA
jgi:tRNA pseudouridine13 synthase